MLKILAALVEVTATNLQGSIFPDTTPFSQITDMRSSTPFTPLGILVKSSFPSAFCAAEKVQLSVPVVCRSPLKSKQFYFVIYIGEIINISHTSLETKL